MIFLIGLENWLELLFLILQIDRIIDKVAFASLKYAYLIICKDMNN